MIRREWNETLLTRYSIIKESVNGLELSGTSVPTLSNFDGGGIPVEKCPWWRHYDSRKTLEAWYHLKCVEGMHNSLMCNLFVNYTFDCWMLTYGCLSFRCILLIVFEGLYFLKKFSYPISLCFNLDLCRYLF